MLVNSLLTGGSTINRHLCQQAVDKKYKRVSLCEQVVDRGAGKNTQSCQQTVDSHSKWVVPSLSRLTAGNLKRALKSMWSGSLNLPQLQSALFCTQEACLTRSQEVQSMLTSNTSKARQHQHLSPVKHLLIATSRLADCCYLKSVICAIKVVEHCSDQN